VEEDKIGAGVTTMVSTVVVQECRHKCDWHNTSEAASKPGPAAHERVIGAPGPEPSSASCRARAQPGREKRGSQEAATLTSVSLSSAGHSPLRL